MKLQNSPERFKYSDLHEYHWFKGAGRSHIVGMETLKAMLTTRTFKQCYLLEEQTLQQPRSEPSSKFGCQGNCGIHSQRILDHQAKLVSKETVEAIATKFWTIKHCWLPS